MADDEGRGRGRGRAHRPGQGLNEFHAPGSPFIGVTSAEHLPE
jgi:hypothetical protein